MNRSIIMGAAAVAVLGVAGYLMLGSRRSTQSEIPAEALEIIGAANAASAADNGAVAERGRASGTPAAGRLDTTSAGETPEEELQEHDAGAAPRQRAAQARRRLPRRGKKSGKGIEDLPEGAAAEEDRRKPAGVATDGA